MSDALWRIRIDTDPAALAQLIARGKTSNEALRALANRLVGILHGCLRRHCQYDDSIAWPEGLAVAT